MLHAARTSSVEKSRGFRTARALAALFIQRLKAALGGKADIGYRATNSCYRTKSEIM